MTWFPAFPALDRWLALYHDITHSNGAGQHWQDCIPLGTYDQAFNTLGEKELCPGSAMLEKINAALR